MRGTGYISEQLDSTIDLDPLLSSAGAPVDWDNRPRCGEITDQGQTGSCVAHALANAIQLRKSVRWHISPKPCILSLYALARVHSGKTVAEDTGAGLKSSLAAVTEHGWCPDTVWPWDVAEVHNPEPWDVAQAGYDQIGLRWHVVGSDRKTQIKNACCAGLPVLVGTTVDDSFDALRSSDVWGGCDDGAGHCMLVVGYDADGVIVMNSWGKSWGDDGFGRIAWSHVCGSKTHVVAVLETV